MIKIQGNRQKPSKEKTNKRLTICNMEGPHAVKQPRTIFNAVHPKKDKQTNKQKTTPPGSSSETGCDMWPTSHMFSP